LSNSIDSMRKQEHRRKNYNVSSTKFNLIVIEHYKLSTHVSIIQHTNNR